MCSVTVKILFVYHSYFRLLLYFFFYVKLLGMNKMVINHLDKLFVTNDAATMLHELEVQHPAAKMLLFASQMQEQECGDGTNWVLIFAGALLDSAEELLKMVGICHELYIEFR